MTIRLEVLYIEIIISAIGQGTEQHTIGTMSSSLSASSRSRLAAASDELLLAGFSSEDCPAGNVAAALKRFDITSQSGCGGSGSTVRWPSNRNPEKIEL